MTEDLGFVCPECKSPIKHMAGMTLGEVLSLRHNSEHQAVKIDVIKMEINAKESRIAELEAQLLAGNEWLTARTAVLQDFAEANARIAELEAALKPFADNANYFDNEPLYTDDDSPCESFNTLADFRAARAALENK